MKKGNKKIACEGVFVVCDFFSARITFRALAGVAQAGRAHVLREVSGSNPFSGFARSELSNP